MVTLFVAIAIWTLGGGTMKNPTASSLGAGLAAEGVARSVTKRLNVVLVAEMPATWRAPEAVADAGQLLMPRMNFGALRAMGCVSVIVFVELFPRLLPELEAAVSAVAVSVEYVARATQLP